MKICTKGRIAGYIKLFYYFQIPSENETSQNVTFTRESSSSRSSDSGTESESDPPLVDSQRKRKRKYKQCYRPEWEEKKEFKEWLQRADKDKSKAFCKYCKCLVTSKLSALQMHAASQKHLKNAEPFSAARLQTMDTFTQRSTNANSKFDFIFTELDYFMLTSFHENKSSMLYQLIKNVFRF